MTPDEHDDGTGARDREDGARNERSPDRGGAPGPRPIESSAPESFGLVQVWWGDGKGKTTAALGMGVRAAGHGYRVHLLQFMKGGASSVEDVRGEYNAIAAIPGITYEHAGHYGWHALRDGTADEDHAAAARAGVGRAGDLIEAAREAELSAPLALDGPAEDGVHMLILDELLYAAARELVEPATVVGLVDDKPSDLELVVTGGHQRPDYLEAHADLITNVRKEKHPFDAGTRARKGTEY